MACSPILTVKNLSVCFGELPETVNQVSFDLYAGQTLALVGESGSGKSVTAHSLLKLLSYPFAHHPSGEVLFEGRDLLSLNEKQMQGIRGNDIAMIFQEPMTALNPLHTIEKQIAESLSVHQHIHLDKARPQVLAWLDKVGIPNPQERLNSYPHELSGGQRQRVMIAMALINQPKILIADEPTTALDVTVQKQILELINSLKDEFNMAVLFISHDLGVVKRYSDTIAVMRHGEIVEDNTTAQVFASPQHAYTQLLINAEPSGQPKACTSHEVMLKANNVNVQFALKKSFFGKTIHALHAVDNISVTIKKGETLGIIGESGSGKSTFAMALLQLQAYSGEVFLHEHALHALPKKALQPLRKRLQIVFQDPFGSLSPRMTIAQIIAEGLRVHSQDTDDNIDQQVVDMLNEVELDPALRHRYVHEFSGGQRQRIAIARALILKPDVIVLDEPTSALDRAVQAQVIDLLRDLQAKYQLTYIFISHDIKVVRALAHNIIVMRNGKVIESGETQTVLNTPQNTYTKTLLSAAWLDG